MSDHHPNSDDFGCGCGGDCDRRGFLGVMGAAAGGITLAALAASETAAAEAIAPREKAPTVVRAAFLYPPSSSFAGNPNGWWSWPGNDFDAEARQRMYLSELRKRQQDLGVNLVADNRSIAGDADVRALADQLKSDKPDGLLLVMFYNRSLQHADALLKVAADLDIPVVFYIGLGVKHGSVAQYRRPGVHFIQSLDNIDAICSGLRIIAAKKRMGQSKLLSITEAPEPREGVESFFGTTVRVIPFGVYAEKFKAAKIDDGARKLIAEFTGGATEMRGITAEAQENAARAHLALTQMLEEEQADGLTMNCLRRGMLKPCISFSLLNSQLIPATCENDFPAMYTQLLGQLLTGRPGFQHNPCFETEKNHYYASHCTCPTKVYGPEGNDLPYLLRRFAHTNEGSCAIQVFWNPDDPVTMVRYYPGKPPKLDVYAGRVVQSHPMPPAAGCTTNVEIEVLDRPDACMVSGHHNLLFAGDFARQFRAFARMFEMGLANTGCREIWPA